MSLLWTDACEHALSDLTGISPEGHMFYSLENVQLIVDHIFLTALVARKLKAKDVVQVLAVI